MRARVASEGKIRCPRCNGPDIRHSLPRGIVDSLMATFGRTPHRCRRCERRFYVHRRDEASPVVTEPEEAG